MSQQILEAILAEVSQMKKIVAFLFSERLKEQLGKITSTSGRKRIWNLLDGSKTTAEIAKISKTSIRTVQVFVKELKELALVDDSIRGYPKRLFDITL